MKLELNRATSQRTMKKSVSVPPSYEVALMALIAVKKIELDRRHNWLVYLNLALALPSTSPKPSGCSKCRWSSKGCANKHCRDGWWGKASSYTGWPGNWPGDAGPFDDHMAEDAKERTDVSNDEDDALKEDCCAPKRKLWVMDRQAVADREEWWKDREESAVFSGMSQRFRPKGERATIKFI